MLPRYFHVYVNGSSMFERMKRKEKKTKNEKRSTVKHKEVGNIEDSICDF